MYDKNGNVVTRYDDGFSYTDNLISVDAGAFSYQITLSSGLATKITEGENTYKELFYDADQRVNVIKSHFYDDVITYNLSYKKGI